MACGDPGASVTVTKLVTCRHCRQRFARPSSQGRPPRFCGQSCRQRAYEARTFRRRPRVSFGHQPVPGLVTDDNRMTPPWLADALVERLRPHGRILEPCAGDGAFVQALVPYAREVLWCEVDPARQYSNGQDFLTWEPSDHVDWIITNPPWSRIRPFLAHSLRVADHVGFLMTVNHAWTRCRCALVREAGFGLQRIIEFDRVPSFSSTGFQLGMVLWTRGHKGPVDREFLEVRRPPSREDDVVGVLLDQQTEEVTAAEP